MGPLTLRAVTDIWGATDIVLGAGPEDGEQSPSGSCPLCNFYINGSKRWSLKDFQPQMHRAGHTQFLTFVKLARVYTQWEIAHTPSPFRLLF